MQEEGRSGVAIARDAAESFLELHRREYAGQVRWLLLARVLVMLVCLAALLLYEEGDPRLFASAHVTLVVALAVAAAQLAWLRRARDLERLVLSAVVLDLITEIAQETQTHVAEARTATMFGKRRRAEQRPGAARGDCSARTSSATGEPRSPSASTSSAPPSSTA